MKIAIIDVSSYIFRAFHALPPMHSPNGEPANSLYGFASMFLKTMQNFEGFCAIGALDSKGPTFRKKEYSEYKANRKEVDPDLKKQFPYIEEMLKALGIIPLASEGFEADDIIASVAAENPENEIVIISSDKDLMQLINDRTTMYDGMKDRHYGSDEVREKFGVGPEKMRDLLALMGDSSDNVPGLPGIGPKTGAKLLNDFGNIEGLYANIDQLKPAVQNKLLENREQLEISRKLVSLRSDIKLNTKGLSPWSGVDTQLFQEFAEKFGFRSLLKKTGLHKNTDNSDSRLFTELKEWKQNFFVPGENETYFGIYDKGLFYLGNKGVYNEFDIENIPRGSSVFSFDVKSFLNYPFPEGIKFIDLKIAFFCQDSGRHGYSMNNIASASGFIPENPETVGDKFSFLETLHSKLDLKNERKHLLEDIEMPNLEAVRGMEQHGFMIDRKKLEGLKKEFMSTLNNIEKQISEYADGDFNPASPKQLGELLFDKLGLPHGKKTKTGYSTDHSVLEKLAEKNLHPLPQLIIRHREYSKLLSTYVEPILNGIEKDGRLRTTFIVTHAATGRLASRNPNLQNIPVKTAEGRKIREIFTAPPGKKLISLDYSQIELRILASLSHEKELINAFKNGEDIHSKTASAIFNILPGMVDAEMRRHAKAVNFGIIYGMQAFKLSQDTGVDMSFAKKYIESYFAYYPAVKKFIDETVRLTKENGYAETIMKRRRYIPEVSHSNKNIARSGERQAVNTVIQGSAADIIKIGTVNVHRMLQQKFPAAKILLQIHDELVIEIPEDNNEIVQECADELIRAGSFLEVPLIVNHSSGKNWSELK